MLDKSHRFHGLNSLSFAYKRGQVVRGGPATLKYILNKRRTSFRAAVVVSRKVDKSAVVRNRIRRRVYAVIEDRADSISEPYDLIFTIYNAQLATMGAAEVQKHVGDLLRRAGVTSDRERRPHGIVKPTNTEGNA
jgi:ribonuclease P protein component